MKKITVESIVKADVQKVWAFWTGVDYIKLWCHAGSDWGVGEVQNDLKTGGKFLTSMHALDNSASFNFTGTYLEIDKNKKIKYLMDGADKRECEIIFEITSEGYTKITETFDAENQNSVELQKNGWEAILNNFKKLAESN
jgi:uncharacterized protein YndB with AHSA1/START domain